MAFLLPFYFPWFLNLEGLEPNHKTFWFHLSLFKKNSSNSYTLVLFKKEVKLIYWMSKQVEKNS